MSRIDITGAPGGTPNRLEINDFVKDEKLFSLYIQALQRMQKTSEDDYESFFQVGGIHGLPYTAWDGALSAKGGDRGPGGYCTHGSVLFPTWHRPYVALYEQILQKHATDIAAAYTVDHNGWMEAAKNLRQPYWDWALNSVPPDEVITFTQVTITGPEGSKTVDNPLYRYIFDSSKPSLSANDSGATIRRVKDDGTDDVETLKSILGSFQSATTTNTYNMLAQLHDWMDFSNHTWTVPPMGRPPPTPNNSLESIHDSIHNNIGGNMSVPNIAAFDPIFYLHHANVDRILSLWAALNPGVWVSSGKTPDTTFTMPVGSTVDKTTPLAPFWNGQDTFWISTKLTDTSKLGYTYPDFNGLDMSNQDAVKEAIQIQVNRLYADHSDPSSAPMRGAYDWTARIHFKKFELGTSVSVNIFLGDVPADPKSWHVSPNFVGAHHAFVNSDPSACENCENRLESINEGFVHLNESILKHSGFQSLEPHLVAPYLKENLSWKVLKTNGEIAELTTLEVHIMSTPLSYPPGERFPVAGVPLNHADITRSRPGGSLEV